MRRVIARGAAVCRRLGRDQSGLALLEFALAMPLVLAVGGFGVELCNLALVNMKVSQYTMDVADSAARMGDENGLATYTIDESNINDAFQGIRLQGTPINLTTYGRITLSSLEGASNNPGSTQWLHWQRCIGMMTDPAFQSHYGTAGATPGNVPDTGMGDAGYRVVAPQGSGVMFVEVNYMYQPLFGSMFVSPQRLHYVSSYIVRDDARSYASGVSNTNGQTASSCSTYVG